MGTEYDRPVSVLASVLGVTTTVTIQKGYDAGTRDQRSINLTVTVEGVGNIDIDIDVDLLRPFIEVK